MKKLFYLALILLACQQSNANKVEAQKTRLISCIPGEDVCAYGAVCKRYKGTGPWSCLSPSE